MDRIKAASPVVRVRPCGTVKESSCTPRSGSLGDRNCWSTSAARLALPPRPRFHRQHRRDHLGSATAGDGNGTRRSSRVAPAFPFERWMVARVSTARVGTAASRRSTTSPRDDHDRHRQGDKQCRSHPAPGDSASHGDGGDEKRSAAARDGREKQPTHTLSATGLGRSGRGRRPCGEAPPSRDIRGLPATLFHWRPPGLRLDEHRTNGSRALIPRALTAARSGPRAGVRHRGRDRTPSAALCMARRLPVRSVALQYLTTQS